MCNCILDLDALALTIIVLKCMYVCMYLKDVPPIPSMPLCISKTRPTALSNTSTTQEIQWFSFVNKTLNSRFTLIMKIKRNDRLWSQVVKEHYATLIFCRCSCIIISKIYDPMMTLKIIWIFLESNQFCQLIKKPLFTDNKKKSLPVNIKVSKNQDEVHRLCDFRNPLRSLLFPS